MIKSHKKQDICAEFLKLNPGLSIAQVSRELSLSYPTVVQAGSMINYEFKQKNNVRDNSTDIYKESPKITMEFCRYLREEISKGVSFLELSRKHNIDPMRIFRLKNQVRI